MKELQVVYLNDKKQERNRVGLKITNRNLKLNVQEVKKKKNESMWKKKHEYKSDASQVYMNGQ